MLKPLLKGLRIAPFVECPTCHMLFEYGTELCSSCCTELKSNGDTHVCFVVLNMGATYTPFVECPNCRKLLKVGVRRCPDCYEEVTEQYGLNSATVVIMNTVACDIANSIRGLDVFAVIAIIGSVLIFWIDLYISGSPTLFYLIVLWPMIPLVIILLWFYRFGRFALGDEEYTSARRGLSRMLVLWLAILIAQLMALIIWWL